MNGGKTLSAWNLFVKKIYGEGKKKNPDYKFKNALVDASKRKGEMKGMVKSVKKSRIGSRKRRTYRRYNKD
jgi:hypothetical protein